ncbi:unnamed protein product [Blepharisma stoltei]|uniref:Elongator complex protein 4 n=1 Tax=Blepharisma stoltei TaxID=1481888 RepID=A0AAU9IRG5_9CILI|nr:unnamed protein product [Blepharisma stoltei]
MKRSFGRNREGLPKVMRSGIPTLDLLFQGGYPMGSLCLIEEDPRNNDALNISRCFLGEGCVSDEKLFIYGENLTENLIPDIRRIGDGEHKSSSVQWRYETFSNTSLISEPYCIDLASTASNQRNAVFGVLSPSIDDSYKNLWNTIRQDILSHENANAGRVLILSMLGSSWPKLSYSDIYQFLNSLKTLLRTINGVCMITMPTNTLNANLLNLVYSSCDIILSCESVEGKKSSMLRIKKAPRVLGNINYETIPLRIRDDKCTIAIEQLTAKKHKLHQENA